MLVYFGSCSLRSFYFSVFFSFSSLQITLQDLPAVPAPTVPVAKEAEELQAAEEELNLPDVPTKTPVVAAEENSGRSPAERKGLSFSCQSNLHHCQSRLHI